MIMLFEQEEAVRRYGNRMRAEGIEEGREKGREEGKIEGRNEGVGLFGSLIRKLLSLGRNKDVERAVNDGAYRDQLFEEFKLV